MREIPLKPLCPHVILGKTVAVPPEAVIRLKAIISHEAMISLVGQVDSPLRSGDKVKIELNAYMVRFLRVQPMTYCYSSLGSRWKGKIS